jgi:carbamoyltransferase
MYILGLNINHADTSASIFENNNLIAAVEEERFTRVKHYAEFPFNSIRYCLSEAKINISQVDIVTINSNPFHSSLRKIFYTFLNPSSIGVALTSLKNYEKKFSIKKLLNLVDKNNYFNGIVKYYNHHLSHLNSSVSKFEDSVNVSIDGFGDFVSCSWGLKKNGIIKKIDGKIYFPNSLGVFYQAITQYLGFKNYGDEYKVMGLAPYGEPNYVKEISKLVSYKSNLNFELNLKYFSHHKKKIFFINHNGAPIFKNLYSEFLIKLLGPERSKNEEVSKKHKDIANSTQVVFEKILFNLLNDIYKRYKIKNLDLSGGCAMNSVANGKIIKNTQFDNIYVSSNPGDAGGAIGSALCFVSEKIRSQKINGMSPYLGKQYSNNEIHEAISRLNLDNKFSINRVEDGLLFKTIANLISQSLVVGWFQGRMEWGPRALGNRSILADPRNPKMREILNLKIKRRESFRPFAPSVMHEEMDSWFEFQKSVPHMSEVYNVIESKRYLIPAVTHVDGTGRVQTVNQSDNYKFYSLIKAFKNETGVPIILNTSFNENEPIVSNPEEAISCFLRTNMDVLVLENWVLRRL